ncbi:MAG: diguanylate cyclase [Myxococcales bacterium]|nr:diguanylate cyclase [Myxococcales bacterium]
MTFEDDKPRTRTLVVKEEPTSQRRLRAVVTLASGQDLGRVVTIPRGEVLSIGRGEDQTLRIDEAAVSSSHARIVALAGEYMFVDNKSTNGSFLNDERVVAPQALKDGDRIRLGPTVLLRFSMVDEEEESAMRKIYEAALFDGLTKVFNRKHLDDRLDAEVAFAVRHNTELSLLLFDVDHFKKVNDTHGHPAGDAVLVGVAQILMGGRRAEDIVARYGGEEFVLVLRGTPIEGAAIFGERLRKAVEASTFAVPDGPTIRVTASGGAASLKCCGARKDKSTLVVLADQRLYRAKQAGRNRVISASEG